MKRAGTFGCCVLVLLSLLWSGAQAEVTGREQTQMIATETHETLPNPGSFDFSTRTVTLNSGYTMPINGLGTYSLHGDECINAVKSALQCGVRLIDTASAYGNEEEIGQAIRESMVELGIKREEIFVITKIYPGTEMANPEASIQACLDRLDIGYVDMMLLHHPDSNDVAAYKAMERFVQEARSAQSACPTGTWRNWKPFCLRWIPCLRWCKMKFIRTTRKTMSSPIFKALASRYRAGIRWAVVDTRRSCWAMR